MGLLQAGGQQVNTGMEYEDILMRNQELMATIDRLTAERDEARRMYCQQIANESIDTEQQIAEHKGWDCYKKPYCFRVNGVVVSKGKAVPPKFELGEDDK